MAEGGLPDRARVGIIGGGGGGGGAGPHRPTAGRRRAGRGAVACHLTGRACRDVLLLERSELTSGSTFHSAGLVGQLRGSPTLTPVMGDSVATHPRPVGEARG